MSRLSLVSKDSTTWEEGMQIGFGTPGSLPSQQKRENVESVLNGELRVMAQVMVDFLSMLRSELLASGGPSED